MGFVEFSMRIVFYFWLGVGGVTFADFALGLHDMTAAAYKKGPVSASQFTRMMTGPSPQRKSASKR